MNNNSSASYLIHYGTPKMKWGQRRYQNKDGSLTPAGRIRYGKGGPRKSVTKSGKPVITGSKYDAYEDAPKPKKKSLSEMSDDEIRNEISRFRLEKEYKQLLKEMNPPKEKKARKVISEIAETSFKNIGTQAVTYAMGTAVNKIVKGAFGIKYDIVNPKKGQGGDGKKKDNADNK